MKKDSKKKKSGKKKKKQEKVVSPELSQLEELTDTIKSLADELEKLKEINQSLVADIKKIKKKNKKKKEKAPEVVTMVMEPQVLPPVEVKAKQTGKPAVAKASTKKTAEKEIPVASKAKPGPKPKAKRTRKPAAAAASTGKRAATKPAVPGRPAGPEDLRFIQGLGEKIKSLLNEKGVKTFTDLAKASQSSVKSVLEQAGPRFKNQDPKPLIDQAKLVKAEKWSELEALQAELMKGKKKPGPKTA